MSSAGDGPQSEYRFMKQKRTSFIYVFLVSAFVLFQDFHQCLGAESSPSPPVPSHVETTNSNEIIQSLLQLQTELHDTQRAFEQSRQESRDAARQNAEALSNGLKSVERTFSAQRARELEALQGASEAMQRSNRMMLLVVGTLAVMGFLAMLIMSYFQWRANCSLAAMAAAWPAELELGAGAAVPTLKADDSPGGRGGSVERSNRHLLTAIEQLGKRIHVLGQRARAELMSGNGAGPVGGNGGSGVPSNDERVGRATELGGKDEQSRIAELLSQAHTMLERDDPDAALACFEEVLALEPDHSEALVKKGAALERLHKLNEAIQCYDRAITADDTMTIAYLHKGGLCNRLERFKDALECYEKALQTHEKWGG
jgi:tetratricopeptide (TPR) repeat protein